MEVETEIKKLYPANKSQYKSKVNQVNTASDNLDSRPSDNTKAPKKVIKIYFPIEFSSVYSSSPSFFSPGLPSFFLFPFFSNLLVKLEGETLSLVFEGKSFSQVTHCRRAEA